jgi:hypothetical protein
MRGDIGLEHKSGPLLKREEIRKMVDAGDARARASDLLFSPHRLSQAELRKITIQQLLRSASDALGRQ